MAPPPYSRKAKSLGLLCRNFRLSHGTELDAAICLDGAAASLGVERRRLWVQATYLYIYIYILKYLLIRANAAAVCSVCLFVCLFVLFVWLFGCLFVDSLGADF
jgi:hypothetical protein